MNSLEQVKKTRVWDNRYQLPTYPIANNPWIYLAYIYKLMKEHDSVEAPKEALWEHYLKCEKAPGLMMRWPYGGDQTSHDEIIGAAYLLPEAAKRILTHLMQTDGEYNVTDDRSLIPERYNLYRFPQVIAFLKSCAGFRVNLLSQLSYVVSLLHNMYLEDEKETNGKLLLWFMNEKMCKYFICRLGIYFWQKKMLKIGLNPKKMFEIYFSEDPIYSNLAKNHF